MEKTVNILNERLIGVPLSELNDKLYKRNHSVIQRACP